jgi:glycerol-3-phosphate dehydrogenase
MNRDTQLEVLQTTDIWDVIIIGGGATGLGIALDAASRGLKTLCIEKNDFAKGTSSRSTKLLHGGVRYLAQGNIRLVQSALHERDIILRNAPHIAKTLQFIIPALKWYDKLFYGFGLKIYDILSGKYTIGKTGLLNKKETLAALPNLKPHRLNGGIAYTDGQFDDARLAINIAQTALHFGATVINYLVANKILKVNNVCCGVETFDSINNESYTLNAKHIINATGVFVDDIMELDDAQHKKVVAPSQGVHIVIDKHFFEGDTALMIPKTKDGRVLFAIPWQGKIVVGTTDTKVPKVQEEPRALQQEIDFIIDHFNLYCVKQITTKDVLAVYVGLRPLIKKRDVKKTSELSRDHTILVSKSQLITITGGKWTTYRKMAEDVVNKLYELEHLPIVPCRTKTIKMDAASADFEENKNLQRYGKNSAEIIKIQNENASMQQLIHPNFNFTLAELYWCAKNEMVETVEDLLSRRIRILFLNAHAAIEAAPLVALHLAKIKNKNEAWQTEQINSFTTLAKQYIL